MVITIAAEMLMVITIAAEMLMGITIAAEMLMGRSDVFRLAVCTMHRLCV